MKMEIRDEKDNQITTMEQWEKYFRAKSRNLNGKTLWCVYERVPMQK